MELIWKENPTSSEELLAAETTEVCKNNMQFYD